MATDTSRPWSRLWWALRAVRGELFGFRFDYPVRMVPDAARPRSLEYHVQSDALFFDVMELDETGVPVQKARTFGAAMNPAYVAWYGLSSLHRSVHGGGEAARKAFVRQVEWLETHAVHRPDGAVVWTYPMDWQEGRCFLKAPWICAMSQGLAISALVRAYRISPRPELLDLARRATVVFEQDIAQGGVRTIENSHVLYEEYPAYPLPRVLDGFLFSLIGLYDLWTETGDAAIETLFRDGVAGLTAMLPRWDYRGKWSWYGTHGYLCPPHYNRLNAELLRALARLSGNSTLARYGAAWCPARRSLLARVEILVAFTLTKNRSRVVHRLRRAARPSNASAQPTARAHVI